MKVLLILSCFAAVAWTFPAEDPDDQVELVPVVNTNNGNPESAGGSGGSGFPIIVIRTSGQRPSFSGFPFLGNIFGGGNLFPDFQIDEDDDGLFATPVDQSDEEEDGVATVGLDCGLICAIMRNLEDRIKKIQDEITEIQANRENEVDGDGENKPKTTYEEKVLEDGSILKINRTTYDNGGSFFGIHSTQVISGSSDDKEEKKPKTDDEENELLRRKRQAVVDPFNQQAEDVSFFNQIQQDPYRQSPEFPVRGSFKGDTRVNDLLLQTSRRGGLIRLEPDAEFIDEERRATG